MTALNPAVVWSEDPDKLFITFDVQVPTAAA